MDLDKALKAADVKIAELSEIPSRVNTGGAIVYGTESACQVCTLRAFVEGCRVLCISSNGY
ncbi:MAG: hypothetical protein ACLVIY_02760 [Anaerobutyricum soehngenii]